MPQAWIQGFAGGLTIGLAAALYLLVNGRIMGASGIIGGLVDGSEPARRGERLWFSAGLAGVPALLVAAGLGGPSAPVAGTGLLIAAGLLVGFGARLGNGCTSGHGICGMARLSPRSIAATATFLLTGALAVLAARALGWAP